MKRAILFLLVAGALGGGIYYWQGRAAAARSDAPQLHTAKVRNGPIRLVVASTGRVVANLDVEIKCKASGEVIKLPYDVSDPVPKGKLLVELDPVDEQRKVNQAKAALDVSQAKLKQAQTSLRVAELDLGTARRRAAATVKSAQARAEDAQARAERMKTLHEKDLASEEDYDTARSAAIQAEAELEGARIAQDEIQSQEQAIELKRQEIALAQAQVESGQIALSLAQQQLDDTQVVAPIDGVVTARNVQTGQIISSGISNVGGGTTVLTLSDLSRIFILASVDESDIGRIALKMPVAITADAFPDKQFRGEVTRIAPKGVNASNVVTFEVKIEVLGKNKALLKPEMTANVEVIVAEKDTALLVPAEAVSRSGKERVAVVVREDGTQEERPVEVGIADGIQVEIASGLERGETVLVRKGEGESAWRTGQSRGPGGPMMFGGGGRKR
jgi:HlyD family secretion protein